LAWVDKADYYHGSMLSRCTWIYGSRLIEKSVNKGELYKYYINKLRVREVMRIHRIHWNSDKNNRTVKENCSE